ncbi:MAG: LCP family protein, partial [Clostridia bacterium]|nr:LCP family protein [Clostridia bacterium]
MVARFHYDDKDPSVSILQIPRDTYVKISDDKLYFTKDGVLSAENFSSETANTSIKINEAYYRGKKLAHDKITKLLKEVDGQDERDVELLLKKKEYTFIQADAKKVKNYAKSTDKAQKNQLENDIMRDFGLVYLQNLIYYNFGIPIDYHAQVNIKGFRGVVNAIDGVDLYVPQDMDYDDPYQDLHIHLKKGMQHLNGKKAEQFVRFRGYPEGDVARLDAQKLFIDAFLDKLLSFSTVSKIDDILSEVQSNLYTNISFNNMLRFANKILVMDLSEDIHMHTLPGTGEYIGPVSYFVANRADVIKLVNEEFNVFNSPLIDEDFKIIDNEKIYRPAVVITDDEDESVDDNDNDEEKEVGDDGEDVTHADV